MQMKKIPSQIVIKMGMCVLALAVLVLFALMPQQNGIKDLRRDIASAKADIRRQNALMPKYAALKVQVDKGIPQAIPPLREVNLTQDNIADVQQVLRDMANARGVFPESISPDPSSLAAGGGYLSVNCILHGPLDSLRAMLLDMGTLSSLHSVEKVSIREEGLEAVMKLKAWMTLE